MLNQNASINIKPSFIVRYLQSNGWKLERFSNGMRQLSSEDGGIEVFLSPDTKSDVNRSDVFFALRTISDYYEREVSDIVNDLLAYLSDQILGRIPDNYVQNDSIEFRVATDYVSGMRSFLSSSATTELTESRNFQRTTKEAINFTDQCRFGHTFRGSFGFTLSAPVGMNNHPALEGFEDALPLGRRVVERISNGLKFIEKAAASENTDFISRKDSGLSSNMCSALADLLEETRVSNIKFGINLSPEWRSISSSSDLIRFQINQKDVEIIRAGAATLVEDELPVHETLLARVRHVGTDGNPSDLKDDSKKREIELNWHSPDDKIVHVKLSVSPREYLMALEAHKNGKQVTVRGLLASNGKNRRLLDHEGLTVIES